MQAQLPLPGTSMDAIGGWQLGVGVATAWFSNLELQPTDNPAGTSSTQLRAEGVRFWEGRADRLAMSLAGSIVRFAQQPELNSNAYDVAVLADHQFSPRAFANVTARLRSDFTNRGLTAGGDGVLLDRFVIVRTQQVETGGQYQLSRRTNASFGASADRISFGAGDFSSGSRQAFSGGITRQQGLVTSVGAVLEYSRSEVGGLAVAIPLVSGILDHQFSRRVALSVRGGIAFASPSAGSAERQSSRQLSGDVNLSYRAARSDMTLSAQRVVGQEFGRETSAVLVSDVVSIQLSRLLSTTWNVSARGGQVWSRSIDDPRRVVSGADVSVEARYAPRIGPTFSVNGFAARRREVFLAQSYGATATIGLGWSTLRSRPAPVSQ